MFSAAVMPRRFAPPLFARYEPGMEFGTHMDNPLMGPDHMRADVSVTIFLSEPEDYDGGELVMETSGGEAAYKLPAGSAIAYPTTMLHRVEPVTRGTARGRGDLGAEPRAQRRAARNSVRSRPHRPRRSSSATARSRRVRSHQQIHLQSQAGCGSIPKDMPMTGLRHSRSPPSPSPLSPARRGAGNGITVYTSQHAALTQEWADAFTAETGIPVAIRKGTDILMANQIIQEGAQLAGRHVPHREFAGDGDGRAGRPVRAGRARDARRRSPKSSARRAACGPASPRARRSLSTTPRC